MSDKHGADLGRRKPVVVKTKIRSKTSKFVDIHEKLRSRIGRAYASATNMVLDLAEIRVTQGMDHTLMMVQYARWP